MGNLGYMDNSPSFSRSAFCGSWLKGVNRGSELHPTQGTAQAFLPNNAGPLLFNEPIWKMRGHMEG